MIDSRLFEKRFDALLEACRQKACKGPRKWLEGIEMFINGEEDKALELYIDGLDDGDFRSYLMSLVECEIEILNLGINQRVLVLQRYLVRQNNWMMEAS
jgi:hypothetical protein